VQIQYDVELIVQEQNPICWVACCTMAKGWGTQSSVGVGEFTDGADPSNSCISNLAANWQQCTELMESWVFSMYSVGYLSTTGSITSEELAMTISEFGPAVLLHICQNFSYGNQWGDSSSFTGAHAVLITGIETDFNLVYFNNPWGDKDQSTSLEGLLSKMNSDSSLGL
jgi:hypothetical protein